MYVKLTCTRKIKMNGSKKMCMLKILECHFCGDVPYVVKRAYVVHVTEKQI